MHNPNEQKNFAVRFDGQFSAQSPFLIERKVTTSRNKDTSKTAQRSIKYVGKLISRLVGHFWN
jgi:hypothetical protein